MKSLLAVAAMALTLASCGQGTNSKAEGTVSDSTAVDTTAVTAVDSTTAQIPADTTSTK
jgi:PBP1b-binding outer membrane lipoprotein LpoB